MEDLWTPWRMQYILANKDTTECIFCWKGRDDSHDQLILRHGRFTFTILNLYPYTVGHLMVIPYRHLPRLSALNPEERDELSRSLRQAERLLRAASGARYFHAGINLGRAAGAGVDGHLHAHLVPRDTRDDWSRGPAGPEGLPVSCEETYARLLTHFTAEV